MRPGQLEWMVPVRPSVARSSMVCGRPPRSGGSRGVWKGMTMIGQERQFSWS